MVIFFSRIRKWGYLYNFDLNFFTNRPWKSSFCQDWPARGPRACAVIEIFKISSSILTENLVLVHDRPKQMSFSLNSVQKITRNATRACPRTLAALAGEGHKSILKLEVWKISKSHLENSKKPSKNSKNNTTSIFPKNHSKNFQNGFLDAQKVISKKAFFRQKIFDGFMDVQIAISKRPFFR